MGKTIGRFIVVIVATFALLLGVGSAAAQAPLETPAPGEGPAATAPQTEPDDRGEPEAEASGPALKAPPGVQPSKLALRLNGLRGGKLTAGNKFKLNGTLRPFAPGEKVTLVLTRGKKTVKRKTVFAKRKPGASFGKFAMSEKLLRSGRYAIQAIHNPTDQLGGSKDRTRTFRIRYPDLDPGNKNGTVAIFNRLLEKQGYVNDEGKKYDAATGRAVLAFHKVNGKKRTENADPGDFKKLANDRGGFKLEHPGAGKHVETDLSRQVMVLAKKGKVDEIYHISSGAPATPTILGRFEFYRKDPGTNSLGMVHSAYFIRGYATHGYHSVPTYPASHGCLRNPIPDSRHIYNWIDLGDPIYVYR